MLATWTRPIPERLRPPHGTLPLVILVGLLVINVGNSTVAAQWVPGADGLTSLALAAAFVMGVLALVKRVPWSVALAVGLVLAPFAAYLSAHGTLARAHPDDPSDPFGLLAVWLGRVGSGDA